MNTPALHDFHQTSHNSTAPFSPFYSSGLYKLKVGIDLFISCIYYICINNNSLQKFDSQISTYINTNFLGLNNEDHTWNVLPLELNMSVLDDIFRCQIFSIWVEIMHFNPLINIQRSFEKVEICASFVRSWWHKATYRVSKKKWKKVITLFDTKIRSNSYFLHIN